MAAIDELINQIADEQLRNSIRTEVDRLEKGRKFGLVYENHLPECTLLYDYAVTPGRLVAKRSGPPGTLYKVLGIEGCMAACLRRYSDEVIEIPVAELVVAAEFGDPVYPYLNPKGVTQGRFSRVEEYNIFSFAKNAFVNKSSDNLLTPSPLNRKP